MRKIQCGALLILCVLAIQGCARRPLVNAWRPYTRILSAPSFDPASISPQPYNLQIKGDSEALGGSEELTQMRLKEILESLFSRRGFELVDIEESPELDLTLHYSTLRESRTQATLRSSSSAFSFASLGGYRNDSALGILIAGLVSAQASTRAATGIHMADQIRYVHELVLELRNREGRLLWQAGSQWEDSNPDILATTTLVCQTVIAGLPRDKDSYPRVRAVKASHARQYIDAELSNQWFSCPAVPSRIFAGSSKQGVNAMANRRPQGPGGRSSSSQPKESKLRMEQAEILGAVKDLIETAELALPVGGTDYSNPLDPGLWSNVVLGREYLIGESTTPTPILIKLRGRPAAYTIDSADIATTAEFSEFQSALRRWNAALHSFADYYAK